MTRERATSAGCQWHPCRLQCKPISALLTLRMQIFPRWFHLLPTLIPVFIPVCLLDSVCISIPGLPSRGNLCITSDCDHRVQTAQVSTQYRDCTQYREFLGSKNKVGDKRPWKGDHYDYDEIELR